MDGDSISPKHCFFGSLESARGLAALAVAGAHCGQSRWLHGDLLRDAYDRDHVVWGWLNQILRVFLNGDAAVLFFFVLSGFVLTYSSAGKAVPDRHWWRRFLSRRILRIYPAVIATVCMFVLIYDCTGLALTGLNSTHFSAREVFLNMLLIHTSIDGVMWSLRAEMLALPIVMVGIIFCRYGRQTLLFPLAATLAVLYFSRDWREFAGGQFAFVLGAIACVYGKSFVRRCGRGMSAVNCAALLVILLAQSVLGPSSLWAAIFEALGSAFLIGCLAYSNQVGGWRILNTKLLRGLGKISYSFYLLHPLSLLILWRAENQIEYLRALGLPSGVLVVGSTISSVLVTIPIAWLVWRTVEVPFMRFGKNAVSSPAPQTRSATVAESARPMLLVSDGRANSTTTQVNPDSADKKAA